MTVQVRILYDEQRRAQIWEVNPDTQMGELYIELLSDREARRILGIDIVEVGYVAPVDTR